MASLGDVYEVRAEGTLSGIQCINTFHFKVTGVGSDIGFLSGNLITAFAAPTVSIAAKLIAVVSTQYNLSKIVAFNYADPSDFTEYLTGGIAGLVTGDRLSSFNAWGFRYARNAIGERYGYKRFAGVAESDVQGQVPTAGAITRLNALAAVLPGIATSGGTSFTAFIAKRPLVIGVNPLGQPSFSAAFIRITTQNSRKT